LNICFGNTKFEFEFDSWISYQNSNVGSHNIIRLENAGFVFTAIF